MLVKELIKTLRKISKKFPAYDHHHVLEVSEESQAIVASLHDIMRDHQSMEGDLTEETAKEFVVFLAARWADIMSHDAYHYHADTPANILCLALARELETALGGKRLAYSYLFPQLLNIPESTVAPYEFLITDNSKSYVKITATLSHYFETGQWVDIVQTELTDLEMTRVKQRFTHYPALAVYQCNNRIKLDEYLSQLSVFDHIVFHAPLPALEKNIKLYLFCLLDAYCKLRETEPDSTLSLFRGYSKSAKLTAAHDFMTQLRTQPLSDLPRYLDTQKGALTADMLGKIVVFARQSAGRFVALQGAQEPDVCVVPG